MSPLEECCTTCLGCGAVWCREEITSPGEPDLCLPCWEQEDDAEEWRAVAGLEGLYEVSSAGRIWTHRKRRVMKPTPNASGHLSVTLIGSNGERHRWLVHRLVAFAFLEAPKSDRHEVCHRDGDPSHNHVANLRWGTRSDNLTDAVRHGTHFHSSKTHCKNGHPFDDDNTLIDEDRGRVCRTCKNARNAAYRSRVAGVVAS